MLDQVATRVPSEFIRARLARHPKLRAEMLPDLARRYNELTPAQFRIGKIEGTKHRTSLAIVEKRLCVYWLSDDDWSDPEAREQGVTICKLTLTAVLNATDSQVGPGQLRPTPKRVQFATGRGIGHLITSRMTVSPGGAAVSLTRCRCERLGFADFRAERRLRRSAGSA